MLFRSNKVLGLDIGVSSIKLVEIEKSKRSATLTAFGFVPTPAGAVQGGEIVNPDALSSAIAGLVQQVKTRRKRAATAMWGTSVITKKISIPRMDENLLGEQLKWEAEQYIPFDIKDINLNCQVLRRNSPNPEQMNILLVAAKRDLVLRWAEVVEGAGLECAIIDVEGFALANCFEMNYPQLMNQNVMLLDIGAGLTNFIVIENGEATFARDLTVGGNNYTSDIQKAMGVSVEEAESLKISAGTGGAVPQEVNEVIKQVNEVIAEEIRRSFDFFLATTADATIQKVFITGGGMGVPGLTKAIEATLSLPLETFNPFNAIGYSRSFSTEYIQQIAPYAAVGLGLAMRSGT